MYSDYKKIQINMVKIHSQIIILYNLYISRLIPIYYPSCYLVLLYGITDYNSWYYITQLNYLCIDKYITFRHFPMSLALRDFSLETKVGHRSKRELNSVPLRPNILDITVASAAAIVNLLSSTTSFSISSLNNKINS